MAKLIQVYNADALPVMDIDGLTELQEDFKNYTQTRRLADRIAAVGFKYPAFVWHGDDGAVYVLDAHSRLRALRLLQEDGWQIPPIPVVTIQADSLDAAKVELLHLNSRYAEIQAESAFWRMLQEECDPIELETVTIPELEGDVDSRPMIDFAIDEDDHDAPDESSDIERGRQAYPLAIVLTAEQYAAWAAYKDKVGYSTDTKAFLMLLQGQEAV